MTTPTGSAASPLWPLVVLTISLAAITGLCVGLIPPDRLDHATHASLRALSWMLSNPAGVIGAITSALTIVAGVLTLLHIQPPAWLKAATTAVASRASKPPPGGAALLVLCLGASTLTGCGSAIASGARGLDTAEQLLGPSMTWAHDARAAQLDACHDTDCESAGEAQWAPLVAALNTTRDLVALILDGLDAAHLHASNAPTAAQFVEWAHAAFDAWTTAFDLAQAFGRTLPALPAEVLALIGAAS